eukprot:SAG31_NODE_1790_length_7264_cov_3.356455_1_plen_217_part_00
MFRSISCCADRNSDCRLHTTACVTTIACRCIVQLVREDERRLAQLRKDDTRLPASCATMPTTPAVSAVSQLSAAGMAALARAQSRNGVASARDRHGDKASGVAAVCAEHQLGDGPTDRRKRRQSRELVKKGEVTSSDEAQVEVAVTAPGENRVAGPTKRRPNSEGGAQEKPDTKATRARLNQLARCVLTTVLSVAPMGFLKRMHLPPTPPSRSSIA